jgi:hypothetical protein
MTDVRLADLLVGLSGVADLGMGQPLGAAGDTCRAAVGLARAIGLDDATTAEVFHAALLQHIGCTAYSREASLLFGDEISIKRASLDTDFGKPTEVLLGYLPRIVREAPAGDRLHTATSALFRSRSLVAGYSLANCEVAASIARQLGLPAAAQDGLLDAFETWDGKGQPRGLAGEAIPIVSRVVNVAGCVALFARLGGIAAAQHAVRQRRRRLFDPAVVDAFLVRPAEVLGDPNPRSRTSSRTRPGSPTVASHTCCASSAMPSTSSRPTSSATRRQCRRWRPRPRRGWD